eukprot:356000-Rhodomonas_salina.1
MAVFCRAVPGMSIAAESPEVGFGHLRLEDHMVAIEKIEAKVGESETLLSVVYRRRLVWTALCRYMKGFVFSVAGGEPLPVGRSFAVMAALDSLEWEMGGSSAWGQFLSRYLEPVLCHLETGPRVVMVRLVQHLKALGDRLRELGAEEETLFYVVRREHCQTAFPLVLALLWMEYNWPPSVVSALQVRVGRQWVRGTDYVVVGELTGEVVDFTPGVSNLGVLLSRGVGDGAYEDYVDNDYGECAEYDLSHGEQDPCAGQGRLGEIERLGFWEMLQV